MITKLRSHQWKQNPLRTVVRFFILIDSTHILYCTTICTATKQQTTYQLFSLIKKVTAIPFYFRSPFSSKSLHRNSVHYCNCFPLQKRCLRNTYEERMVPMLIISNLCFLPWACFYWVLHQLIPRQRRIVSRTIGEMRTVNMMEHGTS